MLLGDFNMTPRNPAYARLVAKGLVDAFVVAGVGRGWTLPRRVGAPELQARTARVPATARCVCRLHLVHAWGAGRGCLGGW